MNKNVGIFFICLLLSILSLTARAKAWSYPSVERFEEYSTQQEVEDIEASMNAKAEAQELAREDAIAKKLYQHETTESDVVRELHLASKDKVFNDSEKSFKQELREMKQERDGSDLMFIKKNKKFKKQTIKLTRGN